MTLYLLFAAIGLVWQPDANNISDSLLGAPSRQHLFGTDDLGRDVFLRVISGGGPLIFASLLAAITSVTLGAALGATLAYRGGTIDFTVMRTIDVVLSIPLIITALIVSALLPPGYVSLYVLVSLVYVPIVTRVSRGIFGDVFGRDFVLAAALRGEPSRRLIWHEALPNVSGLLVVEVALRWSFALILMASLNFLGVGVQPPQADWGLMLYEGRDYLIVAPWIALIPAGLIAILCIAINFTADGFARALGYRSGAGVRRV